MPKSTDTIDETTSEMRDRILREFEQEDHDARLRHQADLLQLDAQQKKSIAELAAKDSDSDRLTITVTVSVSRREIAALGLPVLNAGREVIREFVAAVGRELRGERPEGE